MDKVDQLLQEITPEAPSGKQDLIYDPAFMELEKSLIETPETKNESGQIIKKAIVPDWEEATNLAVGLLSRTHDLRVAVYLTRILTRTKDLDGLEKGLQLINGYIEQYWDTFHPQLDPEDDNDPTERMNTLADLNDYQNMVGPIVNKLPLCSLPGLGTIHLVEIRTALENHEAKPNLTDIDAICAETDIKELQNSQTKANNCLCLLDQCKTLLVKKIGQINAVGFEQLQPVLTEISQFYTTQLTKLQHGKVDMANDPSADQETVNETEKCLSQGITGRPDVLRALEKICKYYEVYEPGSPVPLLLQRAHGLVEKNFIEIIEDLTPDSLSELRKIL
ncbi:MAG: type VI secretion system protein TssA [Deltaproteobacteria bacterium]|nr:type VI secretion system protein TssA [Candidatus Tharpella sp.]